jgi:siroheme synthase
VSAAAPGTAYLVGICPGDPDLLTLCALRPIESPSCIARGDLVSVEILQLGVSAAGVRKMGKNEIHQSISR